MVSRRQIMMALMVAFLTAFTAAAGKYALLVGINEYPNLPPEKQLKGCVNDTEFVARVLEHQFGFPGANIRRITNGASTASGIEQAFREHLVAGTKPGDLALFYYSGHGTQTPDTDGDESDKKDEALVPHDVRVGESKFENLLLDDKLGMLAAEVADRNMVFILDCCHSGSGIRSLLSNARYVSFQELKAREDYNQLLRQRRPSVARARSMSWSQYGDVKGPPGASSGILLAACRPEETAQEFPVQIENTERCHGIFTVTLFRILESGLSAGKVLSYKEVESHLSGDAVFDECGQHPQVEGPESLLARAALDMAPPESTPPTSSIQSADGVRPLKLHVAPCTEFFDNAAGGASEEDQRALAGVLQALAFCQSVPSRESAEACVYHGKLADYGGKTVVGVLLPNGDTSVRIEPASLDAAALAPIIMELRRLYLVNNLLRLRSPDSGVTVSVKLAGGLSNLGMNDTVKYEIISRKAGYLTLINVDCEGNVEPLLPSEYLREYKIAADETFIFPPEGGGFEAYVDPDSPVGDEFLKVLLTETPLSLPETSHSDNARSAGHADFLSELTRSVRLRPKALTEFGALGQTLFSETSLSYKTYAK